MKRELKGILSVLQGKELNTENYDWHYMLGTLLMNRVGVPFYLSALKSQSVIPRQVERFFSDMLIQQTRRNQVMEKWLADLSYEFHSFEFDYAFLKGSILAYCKFREKALYQFGERVSNDIDILVSPKNLGIVDSVLKGLGFIQGRWDYEKKQIVPFTRKEIVYRRMTRGETAPYVITTLSEDVPFIEVDVNFSLGYLPSGEGKLVDKMLQNCKAYTFCGDGTLVSLSEEKFLLHLIMHQYKEATLYWMTKHHKDSQLYKYLDIYRMLANGIIDQDRFVRLVKSTCLQNAVCYVLVLCNQLFPCSVTQMLLEKFQNEKFVEINEVIDAENNIKYIWQKGIFDRVGCYDGKRYLKQV